MAIEYLDGIRFYRSISAGFKRVISRQDYLNKINVFPVPDQDTGTNMAYTLSCIEEYINGKINPSIQSMSFAVADSALDGARGNSGAILAQFFVGFADGIDDHNSIQTSQFSAAVKKAKAYAYEALVAPQEGTILTVISDWSKEIEKLSENIDDFRVLFDKALFKARQSLIETPEKLAILAKSGVVDAGAQGFVDMLEGINDFLKEGIVTPVEIIPQLEPAESLSFTNEKYRFCTECVIIGQALDRRRIQEKLIDLGDSIIVAGHKQKAKIHIHTGKPESVFKVCAEFGTVSGEKTDDMLRQQKDAMNQHESIAVVVDSGCDLPEDLQEKLNIHMIPVRLNFGEKHYVDKVTLTYAEFWEELRTNPIHPQTSQPTPGDFRRQYQFLSSHYESIISIHLPANLSGTMQSASTAGKTLNDFPISIIDSKNGSIGMGLIAIRTAEAIQAGKTFAEVEKITNQAISNTKIFIGLKTLNNVVKGGRLSPTVKKIADLLRINPILTFTSQGIKSTGKTFGSKNKIQKFITYIEKNLPGNKPFRIGIAHSQIEDFAYEWISDLIKRFGKNKVVLTELGPALGVHAGPGVLAVAIQILEDDLENE